MNPRASARKALAWCGARLAAPLALALARRPAACVDEVSVHTLASGKTFGGAVLAAASLELRSGFRWRFVLHDDGTITKRQRKHWSSRFPGTRFVARREADAEAARALAARPSCAAHRAKFNLALKFFDFATFADRPRFAVLDSDAIFFRRPSELLAWVKNGERACLYNEDTKEKFCAPRAMIEEAMGVRLPPRFNSGLVWISRDVIDLDAAERLLRAIGERAHAPQFFEQTLYALMASTGPGGRALPRSYEISWGYWRARGCVCRHYVGDFKHDLLFIEAAPALLAAAIGSRLTRRGKSRSLPA